MKAVGDDYEEQATAWLQRQGWQLLARNFRSKTGEIDIIAMDGEQLVFLEVRARRHRGFSSAAASVDGRKQRRLVRTAQGFLQRHPHLANRPCRFDVIAFEPRQSETGLAIHWIPAAFTA
jgi:putative endonuclease